MKNIIETIAKEWSWSGLIPKEVLDINKFGNVIVEHENGIVWRIVPEELSCEIIAKDKAEYDEISKTEEFQADWNLEALASEAEAKYGVLPEGSVFYLVTPGVLGGEYAVENVNALPLIELLALSGDLARQIKDIPDGGEVEMKVTD